MSAVRTAGEISVIGPATPKPTPTPVSPPIIVDTNPATTGVYVGTLGCSPASDDLTCVENYATTYRHSLSYYVAFTDWSTPLRSFLLNEKMNLWENLNVTPLITWMPKQASYTQIIAGQWDTYLLTSAEAVKAFGGTVFLRPFHEFNGKWFPYALANQGADSTADANFIAAWQHMVNVFRNDGVTNVRWVWCYANHGSPNPAQNPWNDPMNAYPGDDYVDWVSFDAFNRGNKPGDIAWQTFDELVGASYNEAIAISPNRPVMVAELATNEWQQNTSGFRKSKWLEQMLRELKAGDYPHLRAFTYYDISKSPYLYGLQSTNESYNSWVTHIRTVNSSGVLNFRGYGATLNGLTSWQ